MFGDHGLCGLLEEGAHGKSPKCLGGNLGDFGEFCKGLGFFDDSGTVRSVANQSPYPTSIVGSGRCVWQSWLVRFAGRRCSWEIP